MKQEIFIKKAVIPAAGLGTRFLPFTKSVPKELLPILNRPAIHYIAQEALLSGVTDLAVITNQEKAALRHYLTHQASLEYQLQKVGKLDLLAQSNELIDNLSCSFIDQKEPLGLGHAILQAESVIGDDWFCVMLPDDIIFAAQAALGQLIEKAKEQNAMVIAVQEVKPEEISAYGSIAIKSRLADDLFEIDHIVEKPKAEEAPSNLAVIGRYIFHPALFNALRTTKPNKAGEIQLTDAISDLIATGHRVLAYKFQGSRFDLGSPLGWLEANIFSGLADRQLAPALRSWLERME